MSVQNVAVGMIARFNKIHESKVDMEHATYVAEKMVASHKTGTIFDCKLLRVPTKEEIAATDAWIDALPENDTINKPVTVVIPKDKITRKTTVRVHGTDSIKARAIALYKENKTMTGSQLKLLFMKELGVCANTAQGCSHGVRKVWI